ncbi:hypothetical protein SAMN05216302_100656 [Nitrosomonas aestuarii]|uniref:Uncharacterized protein n=1 Tax=Nitrosomonas aestuarii TaxID=52441 RepID=A0A1I3ZG55_9PROT|nr:hypothetical protein [Nitrosomonas aestuarii]SFK42566.1 hypothetical protein SAMN05216302_100656 [Nitrosomonas aestuarii]
MIQKFKTIVLAGGLVVLTGGHFAVNHDSTAAHAATLETISKTTVEEVNAAVLAFQEIGSLRREDPINTDAIRSAYVNSIQALAQQADAANDLALDGIVLAAIDEIGSNNEPELAAQVIDKTLQHVFFLTILDRVTAVRDDFDVTDTETLNLKWNEAVAAFEAIKGTAARENKVLTADRQSIQTGDNPTLDIQISMAFERGRNALNKQNLAEDKIEISIVRQIIRLSLARAYYIGVLREVEGIISNRNRDIAEAREKQKEGENFYRIIEDFITRENAMGSELIKAQFTGDVAQVEADQIVSELSKGFIGRVRAELTANEASIVDNRGRALEVAEEAILYANTFLADLELRLDSASRVSLETALNSLKAASNDMDAAIAEQARRTATDILLAYEQTLNVADYEQTQNTPFVDAAVTSFQTIGSLRRQSPVDAQAIMDAYTGELQQLTKFIDSIHGLAMDADILAAIDNISNNQQVPLAAQVIDKTLQRVFVLTLHNRVVLVLNSFGDLSVSELELEWDRAFAAFQAIKGTTARENKVLTADRQSIESGSNPYLDSRITLAFILGKDAIVNVASDGMEQIVLASERIVAPLVRSYFIGVLREVEGIVENRARDIDEALEKQVEGIYFYRIVELAVSRFNSSGNALIKSQLSGDLSAVNANQIVSEISKALIGLVNNELTEFEQALGSDSEQAKLVAEIAALYTQIILPDLELRLDATKRVKIENALQDLIEAGANNDQAKGVAAQQSITGLLAEYANTLI